MLLKDKYKKNYFKKLLNKLNTKSAVICVIGLGYVGSAILKKFYEQGYFTIGIDKNKEKIKKENQTKRLILTNNYKIISKADVIIIALPTPLTRNMKPDLSFIKDAVKRLRKFIKRGQLISLESTVNPGTTESLIGAEILKKKFKISKDFFLVYSPERISPELRVRSKRIKYNLHNTPKIFSGHSNKCKILGEFLYKKITKKAILASTIKVAETTKMIENIFRSINIALVNELKMFLTKLNIDIHEALDLAKTKPFGFTKFSPGPGFGGHCIPLDPFYLYWLAKKNNFNLKLIKASGDINAEVINWISNKILSFIKKNKIKLYKKKILILGVAYKKNIDDIRESPAIKIAEKFLKKGYDFEYSDPYVSKIQVKNKLKKSLKLSKNLFKKYKLVFIATDHSKFDFKLISNQSKYLFDSRNSIKNRTKNYFKV